ncbi:hypothetical protein B0H10DRAFT_105626 [Mycena sp. CBHHK59/15]|nr:hypothetical protein B0H10DRAFT_105626 [Mycena sp. CBHHK59/15]
MAKVVGLVASVLQLFNTVAKTGIFVKDFRDAPKEQQDLFSEVQSLQLLLGELQRRVDGNQEAAALLHLKHPLTQFEDTIKHFMDKLRATDGSFSKISKQLRWALWKKTEAKEDLNKIERFKSLLTAWLSVDLQHGHDSAERDKLLEWMSLLNFFPRQKNIFSTCQKGTGQWLLEDSRFKAWKCSLGTTLWCHGIRIWS